MTTVAKVIEKKEKTAFPLKGLNPGHYRIVKLDIRGKKIPSNLAKGGHKQADFQYVEDGSASGDFQQNLNKLRIENAGTLLFRLDMEGGVMGVVEDIDGFMWVVNSFTAEHAPAARKAAAKSAHICEKLGIER